MSTTATETTAPVTLDLGARLLLARLLVPGKKPPALNAVRKDLGKVFGNEPSTEQTQEWVDRLRAAGLLDAQALRLTDAGRDEAMHFLGVTELPGKLNWPTIQTRYLVPRALGVDPADDAARKKLNRQDTLAALLLRRRFQLPAGTGAPLGNVLEAIVCRELGFPDETTLDGVKDAVLARLLESPERLKTKQLNQQAPRVLLKTKRGGIAGLRESVLREWAGGKQAPAAVPTPTAPAEERAVPPETFDLPAFARTVQAVARACPTGWFGDNKVFIDHVYRQLAQEPAFAGLSADAFKQRLAEANRDDLLTLSRADLVSVMDPEDVQASETPYLNAVFHFILVEKERP